MPVLRALCRPRGGAGRGGAITAMLRLCVCFCVWVWVRYFANIAAEVAIRHMAQQRLCPQHTDSIHIIAIETAMAIVAMLLSFNRMYGVLWCACITSSGVGAEVLVSQHQPTSKASPVSKKCLWQSGQSGCPARPPLLPLPSLSPCRCFCSPSVEKLCNSEAKSGRWSPRVHTSQSTRECCSCRWRWMCRRQLRSPSSAAHSGTGHLYCSSGVTTPARYRLGAHSSAGA